MEKNKKDTQKTCGRTNVYANFNINGANIHSDPNQEKILNG